MLRSQDAATLVVAEDDDEDFLLIEQALRKAKCPLPTERVEDGQALLERLGGRKEAGSLVILLDLNMPRMDGREAIRAIKNEGAWSSIPVIVLTTSDSPTDVEQCYSLGVNSYVVKPSGIEDFNRAIKSFSDFWCSVAELPSASPRSTKIQP